MQKIKDLVEALIWLIRIMIIAAGFTWIYSEGPYQIFWFIVLGTCMFISETWYNHTQKMIKNSEELKALIDQGKKIQNEF